MDNFTGQAQPQFQQQFNAKPNNNLILAIFTTICCCLPFGIVGIVYAAKVNSLYSMGQYQAAAEAANNAKKWSLIGIGIGLAFDVIYFILVLVGAVAMPTNY